MFYSRNLQTVWKPSCKPFWIILCQTIWHNQRPWICLIAWSCCEDVRLQFKSCTFLPEHANDFKKRKLQDTWRNLTVKNEQWFQVYIWSLCQMVKLNHMFKESMFFWSGSQFSLFQMRLKFFCLHAMHCMFGHVWIGFGFLSKKTSDWSHKGGIHPVVMAECWPAPVLVSEISSSAVMWWSWSVFG